jgi:WD40 repeat protein/serine/threonine protein kinase/tetratricopeptide (TPR) repeat protein
MAVDAARAKSLFLAASDLADPAERAAFLDRECGGDADLRARVEALLRANDAAPPPSAPEPTVDSAVGQPATEDYGDPTARVGALLAGKYKLIEEIGEGGMGSVFLAQQTEPVKRAVAVKVVKAGMDSRAVLARFEAERQALAMMDHPNIAKVLDAGTTDAGRPFFVMELVKGTPITRYCDEHRLTPRQRLELFVPVCQAIQHAHQKGIIHRDIKPSNVLVALYDDRPVPKVIDFGVAKAAGQSLTDKTLMTGFGALVGTPEYMSPEQASLNNLDIDTRSDVYSLGVLLYELLTGTTPVDRQSLGKAALLEILRIVREVEAARPSAKLSTIDTLPSVAANRGTEPARLSKLMKGELDWLVMKALEKDRTRRYETANALSRDIQRYLADEVVEARPPSAAYRLRKFVRRHKGQVIAASLVLLALVGGIVGTTLGLFEARRQTAEKEEARQAEADRVRERDDALARESQRVVERDKANVDLNKANDELTHRLGISAVVLANAAYDSRDYKLTAERLDKVPVEQRGWEWRYLKRQLHGGIFTLQGHTSSVTSVAFSPDGTRIVTGGGDQNQPFEVKVWDARTGMFLFDLKGLPQKVPGVNIPVVSVAFSPDSKRIVTAGGDKTARVWDAKGALQLELKDHAGDVSCAAFSPDGTQIATGFRADNAGIVKVWDVRTGKAVLDWRGHESGTTRLAFSPDGTRIVTAGTDKAVRVWEARTGKILLEAKGTISSYSSVAFSPDGKRLVAGRDDGTARVIDAQTGAVLLELKGRPRVANWVSLTTRGVLTVAFSPDGTRIVTGGTTGGHGSGDGFVSGEASVWDARTGAELLELKGHAGMVMSAAFSPDGEQIITGSVDRTVTVWDARTGTPRLELEGIKGPTSASFSPDGTWIVSGGGEFNKPGEAMVWDARTGMPKFTLNGLKGHVNSVALSKDGTRIVTGGGEREKPGEATVWDARTGQALVELKGLKETVRSVAFSPDGTHIVTAAAHEANADGAELKVWDATTGTVLLDLTQKERPNFIPGERGGSVAFSPDGRRFVAGGMHDVNSSGTEVKVRDARTRTVLVEMKGNKSPVLDVAFSADGTRIATGSLNNTATVWDAETGTALLELKGHTGEVNSVAFSPDGKRIVSGSGDRTVRVWDARTGATLAELKGPTGAVTSVFFLFVANGSPMGGRSDPAAAVTSVSFSADGTRILAAGGGGVFAWDAPIPQQEMERIPGDEELAYRRLHMQPNPSRYRAGYLAARAAKDDFAAAFYLNRIPPDERKGLIAQADADALAALSKLAQEYWNAGRLEEAVPLRLEILNFNKAKLGPEDPATIEAASLLANVYRRMGQFDKAIPLWEDVLKYRRAKLGREHAQTLSLMGVLGWVYKDAGRPQEAIALLEEAAAKNPHPVVTRNLLDAYELAGEHAKVVALCQKQLAEDRKSRAEDTWQQADLLARLGRAYLAQKKWSEAEPHLRECVTLREKNRPDEWTTFEAQSLLGGSLLGQKKYTEAEPLLLKGYEGLKQWEKALEPRDAPRLPEALDRLIELYSAMNKPDEAKKWREERAKYPNVAPPTREKK